MNAYSEDACRPHMYTWPQLWLHPMVACTNPCMCAIPQEVLLLRQRGMRSPLTARAHTRAQHTKQFRNYVHRL